MTRVSAFQRFCQLSVGSLSSQFQCLVCRRLVSRLNDRYGNCRLHRGPARDNGSNLMSGCQAEEGWTRPTQPSAYLRMERRTYGCAERRTLRICVRVCIRTT